MEFLMLICSATLQEELEDFFETHAIGSYTCLPSVYGSGRGGGTRLNTEVWPGLNMMYILTVDQSQYQELRTWVSDYRKKSPREGLKLFCLTMKEYL